MIPLNVILILIMIPIPILGIMVSLLQNIQQNQN